MTQEEIIANHLDKYSEITSWEAIQDYGITRLANYIFILRQRGWNIETIIITGINRRGQNSHWALYKYKSES